MSETSAGATAASSGDDKSNSMWHLLPTFDPAIDDAREYAQKVRFLHGVLPQKDKGQLAPRLAMLCRGTAWNQVRTIPPEKLVDPTNGVKVFLQSLSTWEESEEMVTFEKFERAMYKILQKSDESTMSFVNRLGVAFAEIGDSVTVKDFHAFILLRQSNLSSDDKKKVLTMTGGKMGIKAIDQAMRSLATRVLSGPSDVKKKVYPVNFTEEEASDVLEGGETAWNVSHDDEDDWDNMESLIQQGDADALTIQTFEQDLEDLFQSTPDLQSALLTYQEARQKLTERKKFRGFWPTRNFGGKGKGKGKKGFSKSFSGFGKSSLLDRIAKTHCKLCGEKGHWKAECPNKTKENVNIAISSQVVDQSMAESFTTYAPDVLVEETRQQSFCFDQALCSFVCYAPQESRDKSWMSSAISVLSHRIEQRKHSKNEVAPSSTLPYISDGPVLKDRSTAFHVTTDGSYAVLDTGASRSVIGSELVPSLLKDLSAEVRARVKEVPSHVGFRFGNNQVLYSKSQLQVPLCHNGSKKIWLLVEVVKGLTPFLLSIHAMKRLGAQIDLESSQVYLRNLQRSIVIHENKNGLMSIRLQDLCDEKFVKGKNNEQLICASQHLASSDLVEPSSDPCIDKSRHAEPSRDDPKYQDNCRASHGQFEGVASVAGQPCRNSCNNPASARREGDSPQIVDVGGTTTWRHRIEEISQLLHRQGSPQRSVAPSMPAIDSDQEWVTPSLSQVSRSQVMTAPVVPTVTPVTPLTLPMNAAPATPSIQGSQVGRTTRQSRAAGTNPVNPTTPVETVATPPNLESWGQKCISWGKKWTGVRYQEVYEQDQGYVAWIAARVNSLTPQMKDFYMYCQNRERMEQGL